MPRSSVASVMKFLSSKEMNSEKDIQKSKKSVIKIAKKTVQKWRHRDSFSDRSLGNIKLRSSLLLNGAANYM
jgi:hypothetical protein